MKTTHIAFIGGGNMARSLIGGLIADGCNPQHIWVSDPNTAQRKILRDQFNVITDANNCAVADKATVLILAIKPQVLRDVAAQLVAIVQRNKPLIISVAAGVREPDLRGWLGGAVPVVRTMPNTPALVGSGATALFANDWVSEIQRQLAESILRAVGLTVWIKEEVLLNTVTALSGSGPAYFFLVMEALEQAGIKLGLPPDTARLLSLQTGFGAGKMALESTESPAVLRRRVTSPGGTTEQAVAVLQEGGFEALFFRALDAARQRSQELGALLGGEP